jgi:uncharacterized protein (DUF58 family)
VTISPDSRLLAAAALWTATAVLVVFVPALWVPAAGALAVLAAVAVWDVLLLRRTPPITCGRKIPERAFVGRASHVALLVRHDGERDVVLDLIDEVPTDLATAEPQFTGVLVPARAPAELRYCVVPNLRGDRPVGPTIMLARSPLGFWRRRTIAPAVTLRVYPDASQFLRPQALDPRRVFAALGVRPAPRRGDGMDFEALREFVVGDDPRRIDWAATARRGRLITRLYQHERNHTVVIAVDASRLMAGQVDGRTKLDHSIDAALALTYAALTSGDRVSMVVFDNVVRGHLSPRAHRSQLGTFVDLLRTVQPRLVEADYAVLLRTLASRQRHRALVVVLTDFVEVDAPLLLTPLALLAQRHRVLLVAVRDRVYRALDPVATVDGTGPGLYRRLVLGDLLREREKALSELRRRGVQTLDLVPEAITATTLNRYLAIRYGPDR